MTTYNILTTCISETLYTVKANSKEEAREKFYRNEWNTFKDMENCYDEEIAEITEVK